MNGSQRLEPPIRSMPTPTGLAPRISLDLLKQHAFDRCTTVSRYSRGDSSFGTTTRGRWLLVMVVCWWSCMVQTSAASPIARSSSSFTSSSPRPPTASSSSSSSSSVGASSRVATLDGEPPLSTTIAASTSSSSSPNVVIQLASYVKNSIVKTVDGCTQLWTNYGRCNEIRKKINLYRDEIKLEWEEENSDDAGSLTPMQKSQLKSLIGGITYEEFAHLQKGKEDRSKVMNMMFLMWGAPRFLPYALMFNPDMLPSPFRDTPSATATGESSWVSQSRERSSAVIRALLQLEKEARVTPALAKLNVFNKKQQDQTKQALLQSIDAISELFTTSVSSRLVGAKQLLQQYESYWYRGHRPNEQDDGTTATTTATTPFTRADLRLCSIPKPLVVCMDGIMTGGSGGGFLAGLQPHFMTRGRVVGQLRKVTESDDFLLNTNLNLTTISKRYLQEACSERMMSVLGLSTIELRNQLDEWLQLCRLPTKQQAQSTTTTMTTAKDQYYNGNVVRLLLMGYYSCWATRDAQSALRLPRLLYASPQTAGGKASHQHHHPVHSSSSSGSSASHSSPQRSDSSSEDNDHARNPLLRRFLRR